MEPEDSVFITKSENYFFLVTIKNINPGTPERGTYCVRVAPVPSTGSYTIPTTAKISCINLEIKIRRTKRRAHIHSINHDKECALRSPDDMGLERGRGTFEMVMSTLALCRSLFDVSRFTLEDASKFDCEPAGTTVQLRHHNLMVHGESYYERRFGAVPKHALYIPEWNKVKQDLKGIVPSDFLSRIEPGIMEEFDEEYIEPLMKVVQEHQGRSTWNEMFYSINQLEDACVYFTNSILGVLLHLIHIPTFMDFVIELSDEAAQQHLVSFERIH